MVWCRNLLIYFDRPTQDAGVQVLGRLLAADGLLFVGSSEAGAVTIHGYESAGLPMAFAFRKRSAQAQSDLDTISLRLAAQYPADNKDWGALVVPLRDDLVGDARFDRRGDAKPRYRRSAIAR